MQNYLLNIIRVEAQMLELQGDSKSADQLRELVKPVLDAEHHKELGWGYAYDYNQGNERMIEELARQYADKFNSMPDKSRVAAIAGFLQLTNSFVFNKHGLEWIKNIGSFANTLKDLYKS